MPKFDKIGADVRFRKICQILAKSYQIDFFAIDYYVSDLRNNENLPYYKDELEKIGLNVLTGLNNLIYILATRKYKSVWFEFYFVANTYLDLCRKWQPHACLIVDSVDIHFLRLERKALLTDNEADKAFASEVKTQELASYAKADLVIAITEADANCLKEAIPNIHLKIIPNIHVIPEKTSKNKIEKRLIFVGAYNHDPNVDGVIYFAREIWPLVKNKLPDIKWSIVGSNPTPEITRLASQDIEVTGYVESTHPFLEKSMISIAPLRYGAGMKGKIGEAMAFGIPVVSTSIGAEGMNLEHGKNILIADSPEDFSEAIFNLFSDQELCNRLANEGISYVHENLSEEAVTIKLDEAFSELPTRNNNFKIRAATMIEKLYVIAHHNLDKHILWRFRSNF